MLDISHRFRMCLNGWLYIWTCCSLQSAWWLLLPVMLSRNFFFTPMSQTFDFGHTGTALSLNFLAPLQAQKSCLNLLWQFISLKWRGWGRGMEGEGVGGGGLKETFLLKACLPNGYKISKWKLQIKNVA